MDLPDDLSDIIKRETLTKLPKTWNWRNRKFTRGGLYNTLLEVCKHKALNKSQRNLKLIKLTQLYIIYLVNIHYNFTGLLEEEFSDYEITGRPDVTTDYVINEILPFLTEKNIDDLLLIAVKNDPGGVCRSLGIFFGTSARGIRANTVPLVFSKSSWDHVHFSHYCHGVTLGAIQPVTETFYSRGHSSS